MELSYIVRTKDRLVAALPNKEPASEIAQELNKQNGSSHFVESVAVYNSMEQFFEHDAKYWRRKYEELKKANSNEQNTEDQRSSYGSSGGGGHD